VHSFQSEGDASRSGDIHKRLFNGDSIGDWQEHFDWPTPVGPHRSIGHALRAQRSQEEEADGDAEAA
jgi:hypothetical protein